MSPLDRRLAKLEAAAGDGAQVLVWRNLDEAEEQALQRQFGDGPRPRNFAFLRWARDASEAVHDPSQGAGE